MLFPGPPARITACFGASFALRMSMTCHAQVLVASMESAVGYGNVDCFFGMHCFFEFRLHYDSLLA